MALANVMGQVVMTVVLTVIYVAWFWPAGTIQRWRNGTHPFHTWTHQPPQTAAGWEPLHLDNDAPTTQTTRTSRRSLITQLFGVVGFFARRGHWAMMPILILMLIIGLVLFFISSTALAPFVYTIF